MRSCKKVAARLCFVGVFLTVIPFFAFISAKDPLPKVLLIGDSISIGYLPYVQESLKGSVHVDRIPPKANKQPENCQGTRYGLENLDRWLGDTKWDVIHFNFGLHDIKHVNPESGKNSNDINDPPQASLKQYKRNLKKIVSRLKSTNAKLIFATTTPYPEGTKPYRGFGDEVRYNEVAMKIMVKNGIYINDLHAFALPQLESIQRPTNVHFKKNGNKALGEQVAASIVNVLSKK